MPGRGQKIESRGKPKFEVMSILVIYELLVQSSFVREIVFEMLDYQVYGF